MVERSLEGVDLYPEKLIGDTAYGTAEMLDWLVNQRGIEPHIPACAATAAAAATSRAATLNVKSLALIEFRGDGGASHDQSRDEGAKESFAPAPGVVHELEEAEIQRQLLLRDTPVWPQPGA